MTVETFDFRFHPNLVSRELGRDMYRAPEALKQLVANALDAGSSRVDIDIVFNQLGAPERVMVRDDGHGISPKDMDEAFRTIGFHTQRSGSKREIIGSRGIGRFAVFALSPEARWETVAETPEGSLRQTWTMSSDRLGLDVTREEVGSEPTGTVIELVLHQREDVSRLFGLVRLLKRSLFNAFVGYLARYADEVGIWVNGEQVKLDDFIEYSESERIYATSNIPEAELHHLVLSPQVDQIAPSLLVFATHGTTISQQVLGEESIPGKKYLGLVDSAYLSELTSTNKAELAEFDPSFQALRMEVSERSKRFIEGR